MKFKLLTLLMALSALSLSAAGYHVNNDNGFVNGSAWNNSTVDYFVEVNRNGSIVFAGCTEGQELAFRLTPKKGKKGEYSVSAVDPSDPINPLPDATTARYISKDGGNFLCLYDRKGSLLDVFTPLESHDALNDALWKRTCAMMGEYTTPRGEPLLIEGREQMELSGDFLPYSNITFNGFLTGVIEIKGSSSLAGMWKVKITADGLQLDKMTTDDEYFRFFNPTGEVKHLTWSRADRPRFGFASEVLLNGDNLRPFDKADLRLMRNEILFHHGYVPNSPDLRAYLADKAWYTPASSNDAVYGQLSLIEQLNIELIKTAEENYDANH